MIILKYKVYKHENKINNKVYIGITGCENPNSRWKDGYGYKPYANKSVSHLYYAIQKYGWENFESKILLDGLTFEEACEKEVELIKQYKSTTNEYGYNKHDGGRAGIPLSKDTKAKLSKANSGKNNGMYGIGKGHPMYGKNHSMESRKKISEGHKGQIPWNKGKIGIYSQEARKKISETHIGNKYNLGHKHTEETKNKISTITHKQWENKAFRKLVSEVNIGNNNNGKRVICGDLTFKTITECAEHLKVHRKTLSRWLRGIHQIPCKYTHLNIRYENTEVN